MEERRLEQRQLERWVNVAGLLVCASVALPVVLGMVTGSPALVGPTWLFWLAYLSFLASLLLVDGAPEPLSWFTPRIAVATLAVSGWVVAIIASNTGWSVILLVFTAAVAAWFLPAWATLLLIAFQTGLVFVIASAANEQLDGALLATLIYGFLQLLCAASARSERRNAEIREQLATTNVELRAVTALLAESSRSEERLRIARELHDVLGHQLTVLALELEIAAHRSAPPAAEHVERARRTAKELLGDVRSTVGELRDRPGDLVEALEQLTADLTRPRAHLDVDEDLALDDVTLTSLVRAVQEIVTNTIRHADADHLWVAVRADGRGGIELRARDDGLGTDALRFGNGLTGLRERIENLGGEVSFATDDGFAVTLRLPGGPTPPDRGSVAAPAETVS